MVKTRFWEELCNDRGRVYITGRNRRRHRPRDEDDDDVTCYTNRSEPDFYYPAFWPRRRSLDTGEEGFDAPDDIIETVARVNSMHVDPTPVLPEIRAAPCRIYNKPNIYGQAIPLPRRKVLLQSVKNVTIAPQNTTSQMNSATRRHRIDINVRIPDQFPSKPPSLPKNMPSKDYVMTWLIHGSDPQGSNHFPEIIPNNLKTRTKQAPHRASINE